MRFRKNNTGTVESMQFTYPPSKELLKWMGSAAGHWYKARHPHAKGHMEVCTTDGGVTQKVKQIAIDGDWVIRDASGEFYLCKPDIFTATYEPAEVGEA